MQAARGTPLTSAEEAGGAEASSPRRRPRRARLLMIGIAGTAYAVDVVSKVLAVHHLSDRDAIPLLGDWFQLSLTRNPGAAFSTGTEYTYVLSSLAVVAMVVVPYVGRRVATTAWAVALGLLMAGIAGNLTDRLFRSPGPMLGHVVDFLRVPNWPIFNVADICINVGAGLIVLQALRGVAVDGQRHESGRATA